MRIRRWMGAISVLLALGLGSAVRADGWTAGNVTVSATLSNYAADNFSGGGSGSGTNYAITTASSSQTLHAGLTSSNQNFTYDRLYTRNGTPADYACNITFQSYAYTNTSAPANTNSTAHAEASCTSATDGFTVAGENSASVDGATPGAAASDTKTKNGSASGSLAVTAHVKVTLRAYTTAYASNTACFASSQAYALADYSTPLM